MDGRNNPDPDVELTGRLPVPEIGRHSGLCHHRDTVVPIVKVDLKMEGSVLRQELQSCRGFGAPMDGAKGQHCDDEEVKRESDRFSGERDERRPLLRLILSQAQPECDIEYDGQSDQEPDQCGDEFAASRKVVEQDAGCHGKLADKEVETLVLHSALFSLFP